MSALRPSERPRTARERVAQRRAARGLPPLRPRRGCNGIAVALLTVLVLLLAVGLLVATQARQHLQAVEQNDPRQASADDPANEQPASTMLDTPFTVLLVGVDRRPDPEEGVRSDTLIVVYVDPQQKRASMLSIPRDSVVTIPHLGLQKINTAYTFGYTHAAELYTAATDPSAAGGALVAETVEGFLGLKINYIAQVDFHGFERIIDTLGGVPVDVPQPLLDAEYPTDDYGVERVYVPAGLQILDGRTALSYARSRHSGSDFDRSRRQQQVLRAILDEVRRRNMLDQISLLPGLARDVEASVQTTLPLSDLSLMQRLATVARELNPSNITQLSINPNDVGLLREDGSDLYWNADDVKLMAQRLVSAR